MTDASYPSYTYPQPNYIHNQSLNSQKTAEVSNKPNAPLRNPIPNTLLRTKRNSISRDTHTLAWDRKRPVGLLRGRLIIIIIISLFKYSCHSVKTGPLNKRDEWLGALMSTCNTRYANPILITLVKHEDRAHIRATHATSGFRQLGTWASAIIMCAELMTWSLNSKRLLLIHPYNATLCVSYLFGLLVCRLLKNGNKSRNDEVFAPQNAVSTYVEIYTQQWAAIYRSTTDGQRKVYDVCPHQSIRTCPCQYKNILKAAISEQGCPKATQCRHLARVRLSIWSTTTVKKTAIIFSNKRDFRREKGSCKWIRVG
jgi:hypothetical protein